MNNKGFAISTMLYGLIIIILLVMLMILSIMTFNRKNSKEFSSIVRDRLENADVIVNSNFFQVFNYNASNCVTGNESTCTLSNCYKTKTVNACKAGDIIRYRVTDNETVTFHVLYDTANQIIMQSQKNVLYNMPWISGIDYSNTITYGIDKGPITLIYSSSETKTIENQTDGWTNVPNQTYQMGTSIFKTNAYTGCGSYNSCTTNIYTWPARTKKARIITLQEAAALGCTTTAGSCPKWMYNYLQDSVTYGSVTNDDNHGPASEGNYGYWTMSAYTAGDNKSAWGITQEGKVNYFNSNGYMNNGARAVIVVNKE